VQAVSMTAHSSNARIFFIRILPSIWDTFIFHMKYEPFLLEP